MSMSPMLMTIAPSTGSTGVHSSPAPCMGLLWSLLGLASTEWLG
jgi:hypothetical protein